GRDSPRSASRSRTRDPCGASLIGSALGQRALEVGDQVLRVRARHDLDQLPALLAVVVEDLLGRVDQQRNGQVLPAGDSAHGPSLPGGSGGQDDRGPQPPTASFSARRSTAHQLLTSGWRRRSRRRSRSVIPPQTPKSTRLSRASARHSVLTGHAPQAAFTACCSAPFTKKPSGSMLTQAPRVAQLESVVVGDSPMVIRIPFPGAGSTLIRSGPHCKETLATRQN